MKKAINDGKMKRAYELFLQMRTVFKKYNEVPNVISYNAAISACGKAGKWEQAINLLLEMKKVGVPPDVISYNTAISACEKAGKWEQAISLLGEMKKARVHPDVISYSAAISACGNAGKWQKAIRILEEAIKFKVYKREILTDEKLNLHVKSCLTEESLFVLKDRGHFDLEHEGGINSSVAKVLLCKRFCNQKRTPFPSTIIYGWRGTDILKDIVVNGLRKKMFIFQEIKKGSVSNIKLKAASRAEAK